jgi:hypothetical protein
MQRRRFLALAAGSLLLGGAPASAQERARQISFQRWQANSDIVFDYRLADYAGKEVRLGFRLPARVIDDSRRLVSAFTNEGLADYVEAALRNYVGRHAPDAAVEIRRQPRRLEFVVHGSSQQEVGSVMAALKREHDRAEREFLHQGFLALDDRKVFIDYGRIVAHYAPVLRPAAHAIASATNGASAIGRLELALALIQTIPYDQLDGRDIESGFDFVTPPTLFDINKGDCDSKAVALAAIAHTLIAGTRMIVVVFANHALLGVELPGRESDWTMGHEGRRYLLMEPAGPAPLRPGKVFPASAADLRAGHIERVVSV